MKGIDLAAALLDYYKFFDSFDPEFTGNMLSACGIEEDLSEIFSHLNINAQRHIKIGNTYGKPMSVSNGIGQGDSLALMSAIIYAAIQHRFIKARYPSLQMSSVIDDRNIRGKVEVLGKAIDDVVKFDALACHFTNLKKSAATAISKSDRDKLGNLNIRIFTTEKMWANLDGC